MIIDFCEQLYRFHLESEFDIPIVAECVSLGAQLMEKSFEIQVLSRAAVRGAVSAGIDPTIFKPLNLEEYYNGGILFFTAKTEEWKYQIAGSLADLEKLINEDGAGKDSNGKHGSDPHTLRFSRTRDGAPVVLVLRKTDGMKRWQRYVGDRWRDVGPRVGLLEEINERG